MSSFTQEKRLLSVNTHLGPDLLLLAGFAGQEEMSRLFRYELDLLSEDTSISPKDIVGEAITWTVSHHDKEPRHFNGIVSRFATGALHQRGLRTYRAEVVPWLWFLTRTSNCRIFQNKTTPQIIEELFKEYGFNDFEPALKRSYIPWEYCVQYRESAFNFVSRLLEHEGMFYYFCHEDGKHTLVLGDHKGAYMDCVEKQVDYSAGSLAPNHVAAWERQCEFRSGRWAHTDYNFETPRTKLLTSTNTLIDLPGVEKFEVFDYPGDYRVKSEGEADARIRMEEEEASHDVVAGAGSCCTFTPGGRFTLRNHEIISEAGKGYVLTSVQHSATDTSYGNTGGPSIYRNNFTCIPDKVSFRPSRTTPQPIVHGPQTAVVVGPAGETIYCDKYGRVKIQFHWDRLGKKDEESSCWVRVSQNWGGAKWGGMFIPHVGQEVIVEFEEGDPDRPLITGRVYNADAMPPLELPANKSQNIIRDHGSNEIKMQGEDGKQSIRMFSPFGNTVFKLGAKNDEHWGLMAFTDFNWTAFAGENYDWKVKGNSTTQVGGFYIQHVVGWQEETCMGWKTEHVVGLHTDVGMVGKVEMMLGWKKEFDPIGHKKAAAKEQEQIAEHDAKIAKVREDFGKVEKRIVSETERIENETLIISGQLSEKIATEIHKVTGDMTEELGKLDQTIKGVFEQKSRSVLMKAKSQLALKGKEIKITSTGKMKLQFTQMKANGGPVSMCDGALKVTP